MNKPTLITRRLLHHLLPLVDRAEGIYLVLAFARASGVEPLYPALRRAAERGGEIKILTGDYLFLTEPEALARLMDLGPKAEVRLWLTGGAVFHPKAFLFTSGRTLHLVVGSSNLSRSALTTGVEWNLLLEDAALGAQDPLTEFMQLFYADNTVAINPVTVEEYRRRRQARLTAAPDLHRMATELDAGEADPETMVMGGEEGEDTAPPRLRPAQEEALEALARAWEEGQRRGLVVLPTGLGKTYVAAFAARRFARVLFVAHREEILRQARAAFARVLPDRTAAFYTATEKGEADMVFASVFTLASPRHRRRFAPEAFDLVVVDEFHHAAAPCYAAVLQYFQPRFLLGLTATPERSDHRDLYALCDGNLVYQRTLPEAIARGWLVPFHYYGVWDPLDYGTIPWRRTHYDEEQLAALQTQAPFAEAVFQGWMAHRRQRTLAFCAGVAQAETFAHYFTCKGIPAQAVTGRTGGRERRRALEALAKGELAVIFSVDLFNEGLDLPAADTILLVRPTDSSVVFLQQVGRGLRPHPGKAACTIIDLVGNYRLADHKLGWLGVELSAASLRAGSAVELATGLPPGCRVHLDLRVVDLLKKLMERRTPRQQQLLQALRDLKADLGRRPTYLEFHLQSGVPHSQAVRQEFGSWVGLLAAAGELSPGEQAAYGRLREWLQTVEQTSMSQSYKMVLLRVMLQRGPDHWDDPITPQAAAFPFYRYLHAHSRWLRERQRQPLFGQPFDEAAISGIIARNPMHFLAASAPGHFRWDGASFRMALGPIEPADRALAYAWTQEIVAYRLHAYFTREQP